MKIGPTDHEALRDRLRSPSQVSSDESLGAVPPYLDAFLAHLRLLVGVPFQYLVPDARLLDKEWIRFFYLDRSWTDRLVDGAIAVGKIGTRELAHAQAHAADLQRSADDSESLVRDLQRGRTPDYDQKKNDPARERVPADTITGFLLRSALVSGWPQLEARAYRAGAQLTTLRLERLSPAVLVAIFRGVPDRVELEEPHHGVQFGVFANAGRNGVYLRDATGRSLPGVAPIDVPMRAGGKNVVDVTALRRTLHGARSTHPTAVAQSGSGALALSLLHPPWLQPFAGTGAPRPLGPPKLAIADRVLDDALQSALRLHLGGAR